MSDQNILWNIFNNITSNVSKFIVDIYEYVSYQILFQFI